VCLLLSLLLLRITLWRRFEKMQQKRQVDCYRLSVASLCLNVLISVCIVIAVGRTLMSVKYLNLKYKLYT